MAPRLEAEGCIHANALSAGRWLCAHGQDEGPGEAEAGTGWPCGKQDRWQRW